MAQSGMRRVPIGALQPNNMEVMVVALVINKSDPRKVTMKKDGTERWVTGITLRDSPSDMINLTVWGSREDAVRLKEAFHVGQVMEVVKPRITQRDLTGREVTYSPVVTSPLQLVFQQGRTVLNSHLGDCPSLMQLLRVPSKASSTFLSISDILTNSGALKGHYVDILAAVRKVGAVKTFPSKEDSGQERGVREVRLFDQTADCLLLKLWDSEHIRMASEWIPREHILFLADARIDFDDWRGSFVLTSTGRTVITVNPETMEAEALTRHAQLADFSTVSRLDQFVATIDLRAVSRVLNTMTVHALCQKTVPEKESMILFSLYGYLTKFDIDTSDAISLRCGRCSGPFRPLADQGDDGVSVCTSIDCGDYNTSDGQGRMSPSQQFSLRANISDETGSLTNVRVRQEMLTRHFGSASAFVDLSSQTKTAYKWQLFLKPMKFVLAVMLPTMDMRNSNTLLVEALPADLQEITSRMPSPSV